MSYAKDAWVAMFETILTTAYVKDRTGDKTGLLTALTFSHIGAEGDAFWWYKCDCGKYKLTRGGLYRCVISCGCVHARSIGERSKLRALNRGPRNKGLCVVFSNMMIRCYNKKAKCYKHYGGRGIAICDEWLKNRPSFFEWALSNGYQKGLQIDRGDNDRGYSPENCRWVTVSENCNNKRNNRKIRHNGLTKTLAEWSLESGINRSTIAFRLKAGFSVDDAITQPPHSGRWRERSRQQTRH
jgi:hypothetical protein